MGSNVLRHYSIYGGDMMIRGFIRYSTIIASLILSISSSIAAQDNKPTDAQVKKAIIKESIEQYPGNCPCPYNLAKNGSRCGKRSAYSRPGGYEPVCYPSDVTIDMIKEWRDSHRTK